MVIWSERALTDLFELSSIIEKNFDRNWKTHPDKLDTIWSKAEEAKKNQ
jgi:hypothetical protein